MYSVLAYVAFGPVAQSAGVGGLVRRAKRRSRADMNGPVVAVVSCAAEISLGN